MLPSSMRRKAGNRLRDLSAYFRIRSDSDRCGRILARKLDRELAVADSRLRDQVASGVDENGAALTILAMTAGAAGRTIVSLTTGGHEAECISSARQKHTQRRRIAYGSAPIPRDEEYAAEPAQATSPVLARPAGSTSRRESLGCWLHGVAIRVTAKTRIAATRQRTHER